jgi:hypothetical protein
MHQRHSELGKVISRRRQELRRKGWDLGQRSILYNEVEKRLRSGKMSHVRELVLETQECTFSTHPTRGRSIKNVTKVEMLA